MLFFVCLTPYLITKIFKMKKILFLALPLMFATAIFAQQAKFVEISSEFMAAEFINVDPVLSPNTSSAAPSVAPFWTNNFDTPTDWVLDNSGQNPPDYGWSIDANFDGWYFNNVISSSSGGNFAELGNGDPTATPATQALNVTYTMTLANPIDVMALAGTDAVMLSFEEYGARFNDLQEVQVSTDGINFTTVGDNLSYTVLSQSGGAAYPNPSLRVVNIQSYISGNASSVWFRFSWTTNYPNQATNANVWIAYGWMIDDLSLFEIPANLMAIENAVTGGFWVDYQNYVGSGQDAIYGLDYSVTPVDQLAVRPFSCEAVIKNIGSSSQSAVLKYDVTGPATYSGSSVATILAGSDSAIVAAIPTFSPGVGQYTVEMWAEADSAGAGIITTMSDIVTKNIEVSPYLYGKDEGVATGARTIGGPDDQNEITTRFEIYANADLTALRVFIDDESVVGASIYAILYESDTTAANNLVYLDQSDDYAITAQDRGNWVDVPFFSPISLFAGYVYEFGVGGYQHPTQESKLGMTANPALYNGEHSLFDVTGVSTQSAGTPTWYYITSTPMVRMNFDPGSVGTYEIKNSQFNVYPNPTNGVFTIELDGNVKYDVTVNNILGQTVYATSTTAMNITIDLSSFEKGIYTIELKNNSGTYIDKIIVE